MQESPTASRRQFSVAIDEADFAELGRIARDRRASIAQVVREFVVAGIKRQQEIDAAPAMARAV